MGYILIYFVVGMLDYLGYKNFEMVGEGLVAYYIISGLILGIWGVSLTFCIMNDIRNQIYRILDVDKLREEKESYKNELAMYVEESKEYLTKEYRQHEETMFDKIKDSKLIAAYLEKGSYSEVLLKYNGVVKNLQGYINKCDRDILQRIKEIKAAKEDWLDSGLFIKGYKN